MSGKPGTPRFGTYSDVHVDKTNGDGDSKIDTQGTDGEFTEIHYLYNPGRYSRDMGTTEGQAPAKYYERETRAKDYEANHDGFFGGDARLLNLDERKVLDNTVYAVKIECADDSMHNWGSEERSA